ncbi:alpha/beta fold hydrolase [uncultured Desulfovibrio sp.]|nr:alpha/beta fold hydrolase [uncultured Desulfovibrio sp.]
MPILPSAYVPPFWARQAHVNTIWAAKGRRVRYPAAAQRERLRRLRLETSDGDFLDVDEHPPLRDTGARTDETRGVVVISHGLEGHSRRRYVLGLAGELVRRGFRVLAWNMRSCSGEPNRTRRLYHMGETDDLARVVSHAETFGLPVLLAGFSMGGNQICRYLAEARRSPWVRAAAAVSVPCDLPAAARIMAGPGCRLYMRYFLRTLRAKMREKAARFPDFPSLEGMEGFRTFTEFDERFTAPLHGFADAATYWRECSALPVLPRIDIPLYLLLAADDPFCAPSCYPWDAARDNAHLFLEVPRHGGHAGFVSRGDVWYDERRVADFLSAHAGQGDDPAPAPHHQ